MPKNTVDIPEGRCNCLAVRQAARYLTAVYDQALSRAGIRATQFSILHKLLAGGPLAIGELAAAIAMDRTTLATNLKLLERNGLIDMVAGEDRRVKIAVLTKAGAARYHTALPHWQAVQSQFEGRYGERRAENLRKSLREVLQSGFEPWAEAEGNGEVQETN
ncbi:MarR family winged helix-turn-helix transcriptional regulator [Paraburkholderia sp. JHI2823]|uniref:MarR family winged helix-turn-helix transcriptional regulator n=1 Tax=Paraburkholderia sp. JHI2823 TaxID=3112960 RepID=UPI003173011F